MTYAYDSLNNLTSLGNGATLSYDPAGRLFQTVGSTTTRFLYEGSQMIGEYNASGVIQQRYVPGPNLDEPLVWYSGASQSGGGARQWLIADRKGSVIAVANASGTTVGVNTYDDSGMPGPANIGRFQYDGTPWIPEAGLYHMRARAYSPTLGRFMQPDPTGYADGLNFNAFAHNDPVNGKDPSGLGDPEFPLGDDVGDQDNYDPAGNDLGPAEGGDPDPPTEVAGVTVIGQRPTPSTTVSGITVTSSPTGGLPQSTTVSMVTVTGHRYSRTNQVCNVALNSQQRGDLLRRFAVPGYEGLPLSNGTYFANVEGLPGGFVNTQFSNGYNTVINTTTQAHLFVGTVERDIFSTNSGTFITTTGMGNAGSSALGQARDGINQFSGPGIFNFEDANAALYAKLFYPGC
jgi:RHS repeat-associated protein